MDCDTTGIEPDIALVKYKVLAGGGSLKIVNRTVPEALDRLGYDTTAIQQIIDHISRFDTIEDVQENGQPVRNGLKPEHLPVFDCAFKAHNGERSISYLAHLKMMGAAQPFISGAISKTVNMPHNSTVTDIRDAYVQAWKMGLKCVAIYRDGSKRSQPLNTRQTREGVAAAAADSEVGKLETRIQELTADVARFQQEAAKPTRRRLPETRMAVNHKFNIAGHEGYLNVGLFDDGQPGELFITMAKEGSTIGGLMDTIATLTSMALQYGVPLEALVEKFSHQRFEPSGFTKNRDLPSASSLTDYIFRWMGFQFIRGFRDKHKPDRGQPDLPMPGLLDEIKKRVNKPVPELPIADDTTLEGETPAATAATAPAAPAPTNGASAGKQLTSTFVNQGDAPACPKCGHIAVRNGACFKCLNCGESLGCS